MYLSSLVVVASVIVVYKLLTYRREGAKYCLVKSLIAYLMVFSFGAQAIDIVFNLMPVTWAQAGLSLAMAWLTIRADGNVAHITKVLREA